MTAFVDNPSLAVLGAALAVGVVHTAAGPDHYLPFVVLGRARHWSRARTLAVTLACGLGHVGSSLLLAAAALAVGTAVADARSLDLARGSLAGQAMLAFGLAYFAWGVRSGVREHRELRLHDHGGHVHLHTGGHAHHVHAHPHSHGRSHHGRGGETGRGTTFWTLFLVFVLGPCEPLIPLFLLPASQGRWMLSAATALVFAAATLATMAALTSMALRGIERLPLARAERWSHAMAGVVIAATGAGMCLGA